ncbi:hypothetical protein MANES_02G206750v8 [Manihot esculenta]|uniref:Uncharacterized protein n=1 Tax=Manihot esculenta TaxID=3983 RepID=A0ACB7I7J4_MANES|nr:hypothetical protein MANES_02G206750v8 [Manihot esculenta]
MSTPHNLRVTLDKKSYVLDEAIPEPPPADATNAVKNKHKDDSNDIGCLMLAIMCPELQKDLEHLEAYEMSVHLKQAFQQQARQDSFSQFFMNYNMNNMEKSILELHGMLKTAEVNIKKRPTQILNVNKGKPMKNKGKPKSKGGNGPKGQDKPKWQSKAKVPKEIVYKEGVCFHCKEPGHWKRNCKLYLDECKKKKSSETTTSDIYGLKRSRKLNKGCNDPKSDRYRH